jgi:hypothetical protein
MSQPREPEPADPMDAEHPSADTPPEDVEPAFDVDLDPEDQGKADTGAEPSA